MKKYIIEVPDNTQWIQWMNVSEKDGSACFDYKAQKDLTPYIESDQEAIENEVWEFVRYVLGMTEDKYCECFDIDDIAEDDFACKYSYREAKKVYEEWKKQKNEIHVGDEVVPLDPYYEPMVVTSLRESDRGDVWLSVIGNDGIVYEFMKTSVKKTGRYFPEIEKLLEKMREES